MVNTILAKQSTKNINKLLIYFFFSPNSKCLVLLMHNCFFALHSLHSRRKVIFFVVLAYRDKNALDNNRVVMFVIILLFYGK